MRCLLAVADLAGLRLISLHALPARIVVAPTDGIARTALLPDTVEAAGRWARSSDLQSIVEALAQLGVNGRGARQSSFAATLAAGRQQGLDLFAAAYVLLAALQANGFEARWVELRTTPLTT